MNIHLKNSLKLWLWCLTVSLSVVLGGPAFAKTQFTLLEWQQLIPADYDLEALENELIGNYDIANMTDESPQAQELLTQLRELSEDAPLVQAFDQSAIKIPGFVVPLDMEGDKVLNFLLVPYFGACIHTPPPPSNQIIYVELQQAQKLRDTYYPVYVSGVLRVQGRDSEFGSAGYTLFAEKVEPYE